MTQRFQERDDWSKQRQADSLPSCRVRNRYVATTCISEQHLESSVCLGLVLHIQSFYSPSPHRLHQRCIRLISGQGCAFGASLQQACNQPGCFIECFLSNEGAFFTRFAFYFGFTEVKFGSYSPSFYSPSPHRLHQRLISG